MRRLLNRHPQLFADALKGKLQLDLPPGAGDTDLADALLSKCIGHLEQLRSADTAESPQSPEMEDPDDEKKKEEAPEVLLAFDHEMVDIITSAGIQHM